MTASAKTATFEDVCRALQDPETYPHPVGAIRRIDTHISAVFLTGSWAYKIKKPVDFGFLDFSTFESRRHFCEEEVRLNQRLSRGVYEGVARICRDEETGRTTLDGPGETVEYAVKMVQLPENAGLKAQILENRASRSTMQRLGQKLADFYRSAPHGPQIDRFGGLDTVTFNIEENFRQTEPFAELILERESWELIRSVSRSFVKHHKGLFERRIASERIRDGHGDLRSDHVYFFRGLQIIDCIEFNERFRYGDAASDLAFLLMDLDHLGALEHGLEALHAYAVAADDPDVYRLIDFYACYRAMVRLKVACLEWEELEDPELGGKNGGRRKSLEDQVRGFLTQACTYAVQFSRPTLWVACGLPASGKSTLARRLAEYLEADILRSDQVRTELAIPEGSPSQPGVLRFEEGKYRPEFRRLVYGELLNRAQDRLRQGRPVVLDATFASRKWRDEALRLAADLDANCIFVECRASDETLKERLREREIRPGLSDARLQHFDAFKQHFEALTEVPEMLHLEFFTEGDFEAAFTDLLARSYRSRCLQVRSRMEDLSPNSPASS